jgi:acetolactate synthase small subunit
MFNNGKNTLKFSKKRNRLENSTQSMKVYSDYAESYAQKIVIIKTFKKEKIKIVNDTKFSVTTSSHYHYLVNSNFYESFNHTFHIEHNTLNDLYLQDLNKINIEYFSGFKIDSGLESLLKYLFKDTKKTQNFIKAMHDKKALELSIAKIDESIDNFKYNIKALNYSDLKQLNIAFKRLQKKIKEKSDLDKKDLDNYTDLDQFFSYNEITASPENIDSFIKFLSELNKKQPLKFHWTSEKYFIKALSDFENLSIFGVLDTENNLKSEAI